MGACAADKTKLWSMSVYETAPKSLFLLPTCVSRIWVHAMIGWVEKAIVDLPIKMKGNSKRTSGNSLSPLGPQNKNIGAA